MRKIDTKKWEEFNIGDVFSVSRPVARSQSQYEDGDVPFVASGNYNNGIVKYCTPKDGEALDEKGCITVSPLDGSAFYQPSDFLGRGGAGSAIMILRNDHLNELNGLFITAVIRSALTMFKYNDQINSQTILAQRIKLPVNSNRELDWLYMENYMRRIMEKSKEGLESLRQARSKTQKIDTTKWGSFAISDIFDVKKGTRLTKANMEDGNIRFVGSSAINNGETHRISNSEHVHPSNTITVCYNGSVGETFYQDEPFWASDDVNVLYPKFSLNQYIAMFICPIIKSVGQKYAFIDKWKQDDMKDEIIMLPISDTGDPDWSYMESCMRTIMQSVDANIKALSSVIVSPSQRAINEL